MFTQQIVTLLGLPKSLLQRSWDTIRQTLASAGVCLVVAIKYDGTDLWEGDLMCSASTILGMTLDELRQAEVDLLHAVRWRLNIQTPSAFLGMYTAELPAEEVDAVLSKEGRGAHLVNPLEVFKDASRHGFQGVFVTDRRAQRLQCHFQIALYSLPSAEGGGLRGRGCEV